MVRDQGKKQDACKVDSDKGEKHGRYPSRVLVRVE